MSILKGKMFSGFIPENLRHGHKKGSEEVGKDVAWFSEGQKLGGESAWAWGRKQQHDTKTTKNKTPVNPQPNFCAGFFMADLNVLYVFGKVK